MRRSLRAGLRTPHLKSRAEGLGRAIRRSARSAVARMWAGVEPLERRTLFATVSWVAPADGFWDVAANWRDDQGVSRVPTAADDVTIAQPGGVTVTLRDARAVQGLQTGAGNALTDGAGGALTIGAASQLQGGLTLSGGTLTANAVITLAGATSWTAGAISGAGGVTNTGTLTLAAPLAMSVGPALTNAGSIVHTGAGDLQITSLVNQAAGTYDFQSNAGVSGGAIRNAGLLKKSAGAASTVTSTLDNTGTVQVGAGALTFSAAVTQVSGATLTGGTWKVVGPGALNLTAGANLTTNQGTVILDGVGSLFTKVDTLATNSGQFTLLNGRSFTATANFTNSNTGTVTVSGSGSVLQMAGRTFTNQAGGVLELGNDAALAGQLRVTNAGTLRKSAGAGTLSLVAGAFDNQGGTVDVRTGRLALGAGTSTGGTFAADTGATLEVAASSSVPIWTGTYTGSGAGAVELASGSLSTGAGGATLNFPSGLFRWTGGRIVSNASGWTNAGSMTLAGSAAKNLNGGALTNTNTGTITQIGSGNLAIDFGSRIVNQASAVYDLRSDSGLVQGPGGGGAAPRFVNAGTFRKSISTGTSTINSGAGAILVFDSTGGTIDVQTGTVAFAGGQGAGSGGTFTAAANATLDLSDYGALAGTYTGSGAGVVSLARGTLRVGTGGATFNFPTGLFRWSGGTLTSNASGLTNAGSMTLEGTASKTLTAGSLINAGSITQTDSGNLAIDFGSRLNNQPAGLYDLQGDGGIAQGTGGGGTIPSVFNFGTLRKSGGTGTSTIPDTVAFLHGDDTVDVRTGTLAIAGNGNSLVSTGGTFTVATGAVLDLSGGNGNTLEGDYTGSGGGVVSLNSGQLQLLDATSLDFPAGLFQWTGGALRIFNGTTNTGSGATNLGFITIAGAASKSLLATKLNNAGTLFQTGTGATTVNITTLNNTGTLLQTGTGTTTVNITTLNNTGTLDIEAGALTLTGSVAQISGQTLTGGTWVVGGAGSLSLGSTNLTTNQASVTLDGPAAAFANVNGLTSNAGSFAVRGGRTFATAGNFTNTGTLTVGPTSVLSVQGTYTQGAAGTLAVELGGAPATGQFGKLAATGTAALNGTLRATASDGYVPAGGDAFTVVTYPSHTGTFSTFDLPIAGTVFFQAAVNATDVVLNGSNSTTNLRAQSVDSVTPSGGGVAGQAVRVTYTVRNVGVADTPVASWTDSIYLAIDPTLETNAPADAFGLLGVPVGPVLIGRVTHAGPVAAGGSYTDSLDATIPGIQPGNYHVVVIADSQSRVPDADRSDNHAATAAPIAFDIQPLTPGVTVAGSLTDGQDRFFRVDVPDGQDVVLTANFAAAAEADFGVRYASVPLFGNLDVLAADATLLQQKITLSGEQPGTYFILLHGREGAGAGGQPFDITATIPPLTILDVGPDRGGNVGNTTLAIQGLQLGADDSVTLANGPGGASRTATSISAQSSRLIYATFDLTGLPTGTYDVRVSNPGGQSAVRAAAFTVQPGTAAPSFEVSISAPADIRLGRQVPVVVTYENTGNRDVALPFLTVDVPAGGELRFLPDVEAATSRITLLAPSVVPGLEVLPVGAKGSVTLYYTATTVTSRIRFNLYADTVDDPAFAAQPIDWGGVAADLEPAGVDPVAWADYIAAERERYGDTYGSLFRFLTAQIRVPGADFFPRQAFVGGQWQFDLPDTFARFGAGSRGLPVGGDTTPAPVIAAPPVPKSSPPGRVVKGRKIQNIHVLIIADEDFGGGSNSLPGTLADGDAVQKLFDQGLNAPASVTLLADRRKSRVDDLNADIVKEEIRAAVDAAGPDDLVLVFNSTHGTAGKNAGAIYHDSSFMTASDFEEAFSGARGPVVFVDDTCHAEAVTADITNPNVMTIASSRSYQTASDTGFTPELVKALQQTGDLDRAYEIARANTRKKALGEGFLTPGEIAAYNGLPSIPTGEELEQFLAITPPGPYQRQEAAFKYYKSLGASTADANKFASAFDNAVSRSQDPVADFKGFSNIKVTRPDSKKQVTKQVGTKQTNGKTRGTTESTVVTSHDPNELIGPAGVGAGRFVTPDPVLTYTVLFENQPSATAPAQTVVVTQQLDPDLDLSTFQLGDFGFGEFVVHVPPGHDTFQTRVFAVAELGLLVDVTAGVDFTTGVATWSFTAIDPATLDQPAGDVLAGFLPPEDGTGRGDGFVTYTVRAKDATPTGALINAQASIVFDVNAAIATNSTFNTIDAGGPASRVNALAATTTTANFAVSWAGQDDAGGSGIASFDVFVSDDGGAYTLFRDDTTATGATFAGANGHTYRFYSVATDRVGHVEAAPTAPDAQTTVNVGPPPTGRSLSVNDVAAFEGNSGTTRFTFTVRLSSPAVAWTRVAYTVADGSATAADGDFVAARGTLNIYKDHSTAVVTVNVKGDKRVEGDETFALRLSNPINATIADATGVGTIRNDDQVAGTVSRLFLTDPRTGGRITEITDGATLNLSGLPARLNIEAETAPPQVGSVRFVLDGGAATVDNTAAYRLFGSSGAALTPGQHVLTVTPYSKANAGGTAGPTLTIHFTVVRA